MIGPRGNWVGWFDCLDWVVVEAGPATSPVNPGSTPFEVLVVLVEVGLLDGLEDAISAGAATRPDPTSTASRSGRTVLPCLNVPFNQLTPQASVYQLAK